MVLHVVVVQPQSGRKQKLYTISTVFGHWTGDILLKQKLLGARYSDL